MLIIVVVVNVSRRLNFWGRGGCCGGSRRWLCGIVVIVAV
jgi:hypothetical protein